MQIFIPTRGRSNCLTSLAWVKSISPTPLLVVDEDEVSAYRVVSSSLLVAPSSVVNISTKRQFIIEYAVRKHIDKIAMLDDDIRQFSRRCSPTARTKGKFSLLTATIEDVRSAFKLMERWLGPELPHCGISARELNNFVEEDYDEATRMLRCLCYHVPTLARNKVRFDRVDTREDLDVTLQLLRLGLKNRVTYLVAQDQASSNSVGGCSIYRDASVISDSAQKLANLHPGFVQLLQKTTKHSWGGGTRTEVKIQWKRAYKSGLKGA